MAPRTNKTKAGIVAGGVAAALLAGAGAYLLYASPKGRTRRTKLKSWMHTFKDDVVDGFHRSEEWNKAAFHNVVDAATKRYSALKDIDPDELRQLASGIKKQWATFSRILGSKKTRVRKTPRSKRRTR